MLPSRFVYIIIVAGNFGCIYSISVLSATKVRARMVVKQLLVRYVGQLLHRLECDSRCFLLCTFVALLTRNCHDITLHNGCWAQCYTHAYDEITHGPSCTNFIGIIGPSPTREINFNREGENVVRKSTLWSYGPSPPCGPLVRSIKSRGAGLLLRKKQVCWVGGEKFCWKRKLSPPALRHSSRSESPR